MLTDDKLYYDAFVIYNPAGNDLNFVKELADKLEAPPYNLRLFIPWRDDLPGSSRYEISAHMIIARYVIIENFKSSNTYILISIVIEYIYFLFKTLIPGVGERL